MKDCLKQFVNTGYTGGESVCRNKSLQKMFSIEEACVTSCHRKGQTS